MTINQNDIDEARTHIGGEWLAQASYSPIYATLMQALAALEREVRYQEAPDHRCDYRQDNGRMNEDRCRYCGEPLERK
jgi:hypothetical protein